MWPVKLAAPVTDSGRHRESPYRPSHLCADAQPPSGESWADVVLRVRSLLGDLREGFAGERVWLFTHQAVIMSLRYVLDGLDEARLLAVEKDDPLGNASMTTYTRQGDGLVLESFGDATAVDSYGADRTHEPSEAEVGRG